MSFNPKDKSDIQDLKKSMELSQRQMEHTRETRRKMIVEYAGQNYSTDAQKMVPTNFLEQAVSTYLRMTAAKRPAALVTTDSPDLRATEAELQIGVNDVIKAIDLESKIDRWVLDGIFSMGIMKVGLKPSDTELVIDDYSAANSDIFAETVDLDEWVHDMFGRHFENVRYQGHRVRSLMDNVRDGDFFDGEAKDLLQPVSRLSNRLGAHGEFKVENISKGQGVGIEDDRHVWTEWWEMWIPSDNLIVFLPTWRDDKVLKVVEWNGPEWGPYNFLTFGSVPNNILPLSPVQNIFDLHDLANHLFRKLGRQAERLKKITGFRGSATEDAERLNQANDGESFHMEDPAGINEMQLGGISRETLAMFLQTREQFNAMAGNIDALAGLESGAPTLGQDRLLTQAASRKIIDMQDRVVKATRRVMESIAFWYWDDPLDNRVLIREIGGIKFPTKLRRDGKFTNFRIEIDPFSMRDESPQEKLGKLQAIVQGVLLPLLPLMQSQGIIFDVEEYLDLVEKFTGLTELKRLLKFSSGDRLEQSPQESPFRAQPPVKEKESGSPRGGRSATGSGRVLQDVLLGGSPQANEMAQLVGAA